MKLYRLFIEALESLNANKMRSMLTVLGIVIGVAAVIAMLSIGRGAQASITSRIESIGTNLVYVSPGQHQPEWRAERIRVRRNSDTGRRRCHGRAIRM